VSGDLIVGVELELMPFFLLQFNSCRFYNLPEENGGKTCINIIDKINEEIMLFLKDQHYGTGLILF